MGKKTGNKISAINIPSPIMPAKINIHNPANSNIIKMQIENAQTQAMSIAQPIPPAAAKAAAPTMSAKKMWNPEKQIKQSSNKMNKKFSIETS